MGHSLDESPYTPPPVSKLLEEKCPYAEQMARLKQLIDQVRPPAPLPLPSRWQLFKNAMRGSI